MKNNVFLINLGREKVGSEVINFITKRFNPATTNIETITVKGTDLKPTVQKKTEEGSVYITDTLTGKEISKLEKTRKAFVRLVKDPTRGMIEFIHTPA